MALVAFGVITLVSVFSLSIGKYKWVYAALYRTCFLCAAQPNSIQNLVDVILYGVLSMLLTATMMLYGVDNSPEEKLDEISNLIDMIKFMISFMIRLRDNADALEHSALYDQLTDCKNRKALDWAYTEKLEKYFPLVVVMCDLNGKKPTGRYSVPRYDDKRHKGHGF